MEAELFYLFWGQLDIESKCQEREKKQLEKIEDRSESS